MVSSGASTRERFSSKFTRWLLEGFISWMVVGLRTSVPYQLLPEGHSQFPAMRGSSTGQLECASWEGTGLLTKPKSPSHINYFWINSYPFCVFHWLEPSRWVQSKCRKRGLHCGWRGITMSDTEYHIEVKGLLQGASWFCQSREWCKKSLSLKGGIFWLHGHWTALQDFGIYWWLVE